MRSLTTILLALLASLCIAQGMAKPATKEDQKRIQTMQKAYDVAKADFSKHPKDAAAKKRFVAAAVKYGHESMMSPVLEPRVKYRQALHIYREVLALDPKNPVAKPESDMIISIYKSMGRPVPKD